jgi:hypothetical protein
MLDHSYTAVLVDRHAAHHNRSAPVQVWNKMALSALSTEITTIDPFEFWSGPRRNMIEHLGKQIPTFRSAKGKSLKDDLIKIVYVNRQGTSRKLSDNDHDHLVKLLTRLEMDTMEHEKRIVAQILKFEDIDVSDQIRAVLDADVSCEVEIHCSVEKNDGLIHRNLFFL